MRIDQRNRIRELSNEGYSVSELAIMYHVSENNIETILEGSDEL